MGHWDDIRRQARSKRTEVLRQRGGSDAIDAPLAAGELLDAVEQVTGVPRIPLAPNDPLLYGAEAWLGGDPQDEIIYFNEGAPGWRAAFYQCHEYAHLWLHHVHELKACDVTEVDPSAHDVTVPTGTEHAQGYGPAERREREANVFAREFLLPADSLAAWYLRLGMDLFGISSAVGVPPSLVAQQLAYALLTPSIPSAAPEASPGQGTWHLDESQRRAAHVERGPVLIEAGPGTGKTRTLVGRILYLLEQGVKPASILALTFSNKAAEEMRARVATVAPVAAQRMWVGTFHSFGLELLRKYGEHIGLPPRARLTDPVETVRAVEHALAELKLEHYIDLREPARFLPDILSAISRAKDELAGPGEYEALGLKMLESAGTPEEKERAEKALEVARVYAHYELMLRREGLVDFGDLIFRTVTLLREHPGVRDQVRLSFRHILVDEYQDVNRASGLLLRELAGGGAGLWAVGDARQAIYRFRGAAPANMRLFTTDFPGARVLPLEVNYRSQPAIVATIAELAPRMKASSGGDFSPWQPHRPHHGGYVSMEVAEDGAAEAAGLVRGIERRHTAGIPYREQAVICRSHSALAQLGEALEAAGIPVLYIGDLFEREEVRDLLALLSLTTGRTCEALLRVARFPEYAVPFHDVQALIDISREKKVPFADALTAACESGAVSEEGRSGLALLASHLTASTRGRLSPGAGPWHVLSRYLFAESSYLERLLDDASPGGQQKRLALFQLLQFALDQSRQTAPDGIDTVHYMLDYIRRVELLGEARGPQQMPEWAVGIDAVRLMTVHASKGLEFSAVYLPRLGAGSFPPRRKSQVCPPPDGLLSAENADWLDEEEECLFFVALSRARDYLCLSRARKYGARTSKSSPLLALVAAQLPANPDGPVTWPAVQGGRATEASSLSPLPEAAKPGYTLQMLETYMKCPRRFYYAHQLNIDGGEDEAAYVRFRRCLDWVLDWVGTEQSAGRTIGTEDALARLMETWAEEWPGDHMHEGLYLEQAQAMLSHAVAYFGAGAHSPLPTPQWEVSLPHGRVVFSPDRVEIASEATGTTLRAQRLRTGRPSRSERPADVHGLLHRAAADAYPQAKIEVQTLHLSRGEVESIGLTERQVEARLAHYDEAMKGIGEGDFHPEPSDRQCPRCPYYFICPHGGDTSG